MLPGVELGDFPAGNGAAPATAGTGNAGGAQAGSTANPATDGGSVAAEGGSAGESLTEGGGGVAGSSAIAAGSGGSAGSTVIGGSGGTKPLDDGPITEFATKTPNNRPVAITSGPDGNLWFTGLHMIVRMTTAGEQTEFPLPAVVGSRILTSITAGPDGNIWFTDAAQRRIGRITPAGVITEFVPMPETGSPDFITPGPNDGNLWFSNFEGSIWKVTTAGTFTSYDVPSKPILSGLVAGPDKKLWFGLYNTGQIARMSAAGVYDASFKLQDNLVKPSRIVVGPDGNLWFTEEGDWVGKMTPAGVPTEYPMPAGSTPYYLASGPDNALWVTLINGSKVARVSLTGNVELFTPPTPNSVPYGITTGPDGNIWFCESGPSKVARIKLP